jgi:hypothetical protein
LTDVIVPLLHHHAESRVLIRAARVRLLFPLALASPFSLLRAPCTQSPVFRQGRGCASACACCVSEKRVEAGPPVRGRACWRCLGVALRNLGRTHPARVNPISQGLLAACRGHQGRHRTANGKPLTGFLSLVAVLMGCVEQPVPVDTLTPVAAGTLLWLWTDGRVLGSPCAAVLSVCCVLSLSARRGSFTRRSTLSGMSRSALT